VTSAATPVGPGGWALYQYYDAGPHWRLVGHEQGAAITPTFAAGNFTASGGWVVQSADVTSFTYVLKGSKVTVSFALDATTVTVASGELDISNAAYGGFTCLAQANALAPYFLDGTNGWGATPAEMQINTSGTAIRLLKYGFGNWIASTNATFFYGSISFDVS
jgi:hypothetical protein